VWKRRRAEQQAEINKVHEEAAALVRGDYLNFLMQEKRRVPTWAWLNPLAHCPAPRLHALAEMTVNGNPATDWGVVVCLLASDILAAGASPAGVARLQQEVLVPLELDLLGGRQPAPPSPVALMSLVDAALDQHGSLQGS
jgi:hypothetical protein